jgi:hypothetical protein
VALTSFTRLSLAELAERLDPDAAAIIRAALDEDADDEGQGTAGVHAPDAVWSDCYARSTAAGMAPALAARHADAAAADARRIAAQFAAGSGRP